MLEQLHALILIFLEMIFIFSVLALLFNQRKMIGLTPFFTAIGTLLVFSHLINAAGLEAAIPGGQRFAFGDLVCYLPVLTAYLMIYISLGTLHSQRFVVALIAVYGLYLYLAEVTRMQCNWMGFSISSGLSGAALDYLLGSSRTSLNASAIGHLLELFIVPIGYTQLKRFRLPRWPAIFLAMAGANLLTSLPPLIVRLGAGLTAAPPWGDLTARLVGILLLSVFLGIYLDRLDREVATDSHRPLDILFAFFGSYRRAQELENNLREWENRYRTILQNADVIIMLIDSDGTVVEANRQAELLLNSHFGRPLAGRHLTGRLEIVTPDLTALFPAPPRPTLCRALLHRRGEPAVLELSVAPLLFQQRTLSLIIGRDVTESLKRDEQLAHVQRIESLGMLAGGVAHDFNNYIHAILGHTDVITMLCDLKDPEIATHLQKITEIAEKAAHLTSQLLGFARRGKYQVVNVDPAELVRECFTLLGPPKTANLDFDFQCRERWLIQADVVQMRQVIINLMLNAVDAMSENTGPRRLKVRIYPVQSPPAGRHPPAEAGAVPGPYLCLEISDNGCGMDPEVQKRIFEPFFTTKPVGVGTGMGLSMVYGTVVHHHGWIKVKSTRGKGSRFEIYLPQHTAPPEPEAAPPPKLPDSGAPAPQ